MSAIIWARFRLRHLALAGLGRNTGGQDLIEYALLAGFIAVFIGAMVPQQIIPSLCHIYTKLNSVMHDFNGG